MGSLVPFAHYPVRPVMEKGESMVGYVCRYYGANGRSVPVELLSALRMLYHRKPDVAAKVFEEIQPLMGEHAVFDKEAWLNRPNVNSFCQREWATLNINVVRFCPICLNETGIHFALWELSLILTCPVHECTLLTACPLCGRQFKWTKVLPNWSCRCSVSIRDMQPRSATMGMIALARLIANSADVILPSGFKHKFPMPKSEPYQLLELYDVLEMGGELAKTLSPSKDYFKGSRKYRQYGKVLPMPTVAWVAKILCDRHSVLVNRLTKVLRRYFKTHGTKIARLTKSEKLVQGWKFLEKQPDSIFKQQLVSAYQQCFYSCRFELPVSFLVIFDPQLTDVEFKVCLSHFGRWWSKLLDRMATLDTRVQLGWRSYRSKKVYSLTDDLLVFEILQILLDASQRNVDVDSFHALSHWWHIPETLRQPVPAHDKLYQLGVHLKSLPMSELNFVHDLVKMGAGK